MPKKKKQEIISNYRLLKHLMEKKKEKKVRHEQMTVDTDLRENDKISRVCVRLLDESSIYIFHYKILQNPLHPRIHQNL